MQKFDMARAWDGAVALIRGNRDVILIVAGVFFFLPYLAMSLFVPDMAGNAGMDAGGGKTPEEAMQAMMETVSGNMPLLIIVGILQAVGVLGLLSLLTDEGRPTVGEALQTGARSLLPYIGAQILQALAMIAIAAVPFMLGGITGSPAVGLLVGLPAIAAIIYMFIKFSLVSPVIVIDRVTNPINALRRSWDLTKGNSFRLALFYVLLMVALIVISMVLAIAFGALAMVGGTFASVVIALLNALLNMIGVIVSMGIIASVHRELSGTTSGQIKNTFE